MEQYKNDFRMWFGPTWPTVIVCNPETVKLVLGGNEPKGMWAPAIVW